MVDVSLGDASHIPISVHPDKRVPDAHRRHTRRHCHLKRRGHRDGARGGVCPDVDQRGPGDWRDGRDPGGRRHDGHGEFHGAGHGSGRGQQLQFQGVCAEHRGDELLECGDGHDGEYGVDAECADAECGDALAGVCGGDPELHGQRGDGDDVADGDADGQPGAGGDRCPGERR